MSVCQSCDYDDNDEQIEEEQEEDTGALPREGQAVASDSNTRTMMLGEILVEGQWKIAGMCVLDDKRIEVSFTESGKIIGVEFSGVATVTTVGGASPDGSIYGEGQAVLTTKDGETVAWKGMGVGKPKGKGMAISWRGAKAYQTSSQRLIILNRMPFVFEAEADENGVGWHKHWEWK